MTNDDIKKAAISAIHDHYNCNGKYPCSERSYCQFCSGYNSAFDCNECGADDFNEGFLDGARWRIDSVWHDTTQQPQDGKLLLCQGDYGIFIGGPDNKDFSRTIETFHITQWAYIADLLPDRKEDEQ